MTLALRLFLFAALAAPLAGCQAAKLATAQRPDVALASASAGDVTTDGFDLAVALDVTNRADGVSLPVNDVRYDVSVEGQKATAGTARLDASIPPGRTETVRFDVPMKWADLRNVAGAIAGGDDLGRVPYRVDATMRLPDLALVGSVPVDFEGTLDLRDLLGRAVTRPGALADADFRGLLDELRSLAPDELPADLAERLGM